MSAARIKSQANSHFEVRRAVIGDETVMRALRIAALTDAPEAFGSTLERELTRTTKDWQRWLAPGVTFLLFSSGEPAGIVAGSPDPENADVAFLLAMWVCDSQHGTGAAAALVAAVMAWAAEMGRTEVRLNVIDTKARARALYERVGFRLTGRQNSRERDGMIELEMAGSAPANPAYSFRSRYEPLLCNRIGDCGAALRAA